MVNLGILADFARSSTHALRIEEVVAQLGVAVHQHRHPFAVARLEFRRRVDVDHVDREAELAGSGSSAAAMSSQRWQ